PEAAACVGVSDPPSNADSVAPVNGSITDPTAVSPSQPEVTTRPPPQLDASPGASDRTGVVHEEPSGRRTASSWTPGSSSAPIATTHGRDGSAHGHDQASARTSTGGSTVVHEPSRRSQAMDRSGYVSTNTARPSPPAVWTLGENPGTPSDPVVSGGAVNRRHEPSVGSHAAAAGPRHSGGTPRVGAGIVSSHSVPTTTTSTPSNAAAGEKSPCGNGDGSTRLHRPVRTSRTAPSPRVRPSIEFSAVCPPHTSS